MTTYVDQDSIVSRFTRPALIALARSETCDLDEDKLTRALDAANAMLDGAVSLVCPKGLEGVNPALVEAGHNIARYLLADSDDKRTEKIREAYDDARDLLKLIADRKMKLVCKSAITTGGPSFAVVSPIYRRPIEARDDCCGTTR